MDIRRATRAWASVASALIFSAVPASAQEATFEILHMNDFVGASISANGEIIGISTASASGAAFARDFDAGVNLFGVDGPDGAGTPLLSGDGTSAHGLYWSGGANYYFYENGAVTIETGGTPFVPGGLSHDGSVITLTDSNRAAIRTGGFGGPLQYLDAAPGTGVDSSAADVSGDGQVVTGSIDTAGGTSELFRWTATGGLERLGQFAGSDRDTVGADISPDGSTIIGTALNAGSFWEGLAFRWRDGVFTGLGTLPGDETSLAHDVSGDGSRIVGASGAGRFGAGATAFLWDEENGMQDLNVLLQSLGIDLTNIELLQAQGISADGRTIVGTGYESQDYGRSIVWKAVIPPVPEPGTGLLVGLGLAGLAGTRRRER